MLATSNSKRGSGNLLVPHSSALSCLPLLLVQVSLIIQSQVISLLHVSALKGRFMVARFWRQRHGEPSPTLQILSNTSPWRAPPKCCNYCIRLSQSVNISLFTLWVLACLHKIGGSDTSQILSDIFFSYNNGVFTLYSVYFSVTFKKSKQKKVKQTTIRYKYDHLRSLVGIFFFWACRFLDVSMYGIWLASACAVSYAWKAIWLADACIASRKVEHSSTLAAS